MAGMICARRLWAEPRRWCAKRFAEHCRRFGTIRAPDRDEGDRSQPNDYLLTTRSRSSPAAAAASAGRSLSRWPGRAPTSHREIIPERAEEVASRCASSAGPRSPCDRRGWAPTRSVRWSSRRPAFRPDRHPGQHARRRRRRPFLDSGAVLAAAYRPHLVSMLAATRRGADHDPWRPRRRDRQRDLDRGLARAPNYAVYAACKAGMNNFTRTHGGPSFPSTHPHELDRPRLHVTPGLNGNITGPVDPSTWIEARRRAEGGDRAAHSARQPRHPEAVRQGCALPRVADERLCDRIVFRGRRTWPRPAGSVRPPEAGR